MIQQFRAFLQSDRRLQAWLLAGLAIQLVIAFTATGSYHPDQHFQIIEFSSYQLGQSHGAAAVWEFYNPVRPTIQIYLFSGWHQLITALGISNPYTELTLLRLLLGLMMFVVFSGVTIFYLKNAPRKILYTALAILNFSCFLPYFKVQFSSEILSALFFFGTLVWYDYKKDRQPGFAFLAWIGFLFCLAFYFRFQVGFFLVGFGIWLIWVAKKPRHILPMAIGFIAGAALNTWLDYLFFHKLEITPYLYYYINIIDKRAAMFGTSSFLRYIGLIIAVVSVPPVSLVLFFFAVKALFRNYRQVLFLTTMAFILAHCFVGHKEERFLFPALFVLPIWIAWGLPEFFRVYDSPVAVWRYLIRGITYISIGLNMLLLVLLALNPYSQSIHFTEQINDELESRGGGKLYYLHRSPFETPAGSPYIFSQRYFSKTEFVRVNQYDSVAVLGPSPVYIATTFDDFDGRRKADSAGFRPILYSSDLLWSINEKLAAAKMQPINDIWVLYKK